MRKTFKYRLYPTKAQAESLRVQLSEACRFYNAALQERIEAYATHRKSINYYDQAAQLTEIRAAGDLGLPNCHCAQEVLRRLDKAFKAFFERVKRKQKAGFPRFKSHRRYDSITFPSHGDGNKLLPSGHLFVQGVGNIKVKLHRLVHGKIKTVSVKRQCEHWYVCFSVSRILACTRRSRSACAVRNVVWHAARRVHIVARKLLSCYARFTSTSSTSATTISTNWLECW